MIIVFGSLNMDLVINPDHSPAAGETIITKDLAQLPGGKGANQAVAAARAGAKTYMAGCVGMDGFGTDLTSVLNEQNVDTSLVTKGDKATGTAIIIVEPNGENRIIVVAGTNFEARAKQIPDEFLTPQNTILMQMETLPEEVKSLARRAKQKGARVILNLAPFNTAGSDSFEFLDYLILNETEIFQLTENNDYMASAKSLSEKYDLTCIVTLGADGVIACTKDNTQHRVPAIKLSKIVDTTGAGDAFCGTFAAMLDQGYSLDDAMKFAASAGSLACLKKGAMVSYASLDEIKAAA